MRPGRDRQPSSNPNSDELFVAAGVAERRGRGAGAGEAEAADAIARGVTEGEGPPVAVEPSSKPNSRSVARLRAGRDTARGAVRRPSEEPVAGRAGVVVV